MISLKGKETTCSLSQLSFISRMVIESNWTNKQQHPSCVHNYLHSFSTKQKNFFKSLPGFVHQITFRFPKDGNSETQQQPSRSSILLLFPKIKTNFFVFYLPKNYNYVIVKLSAAITSSLWKLDKKKLSAPTKQTSIC